MLAVYATHAAPDNLFWALKVGEQPEPNVPQGWVRVKITHASLNRHDLFTLRGISGHPEGITYPIILGNDAAGTLDDGTPVVIYPMMGSDDWRGDETLDPEVAHPQRVRPRHFCGLRRRAEAKRNPSTQKPVAAACLGAWHGLADCLPCALHQVGTSGRRDGAGPGRNRRYGDCADPARSGSRLRGLGNEPLGRRSSQAKALGAHQSFPFQRGAAPESAGGHR